MSTFPDWFKRGYKRWCKSQPGEEDFLAFCSLLGYPAETVLNWMHGNPEPQGIELLSIASVLGTKIYQILGQPEPDHELIKIFNSFPHLTGDYRSKMAHAIWEAEESLRQKQISVDSDEGKAILEVSLEKWGFKNVGNLG